MGAGFAGISLSMKIRYKKILAHTIFLFASISMPLVIAYLIMEIEMMWYLYRNGGTRSEQSENFGLLFEALTSASLSILVTFPSMLVVWWLTMRRDK
jgi:hypothetical protein